MPKSTPESEYIKYMSSLQSKIRAEEVGLQSWKGGKRVQIAPIKMSVTDILQAGDKLNKAQKAQNQMVEEYLEKQKVPIPRYDEFGDLIGEFKYHEIPPPDLEDVTVNLPPVTRTRTDRDGNEYEEQIEAGGLLTIPIDEVDRAKTQILERYNADMNTLNREIQEAMKGIEDNEAELLDTNDEIIKARQQRKESLDEIQAIYDRGSAQIYTEPKKGRSKAQRQLIANTTRQRRLFLGENDRIIKQLQNYAGWNRQQIQQFKSQLDELQLQKNDRDTQYQIFISEIDKVATENKKKIQEYKQQLQRMNTGPFGLDRNVDETDVEYAERLQVIANEEFPTARVEEKANQLNKEELREKLSTLFRDRSMIESIVNALDLQTGVYLLNSQFEGFKKFFEKRYGEFNKTVKQPEIMFEIERYFNEQRPAEAIKKQYEQALAVNPRFSKQPSLSSSTELGDYIPPLSSSIELGDPIPPLYSSSSSSSSSSGYVEDPDTGLILPSSIEVEDIPEGEIVSSKQGTIYPIPKPQSNPTILHYFNPSGGQAYLKVAEIRKGSAKPELVVFISPTGKEGSYRSTIFTDSKKDGVLNLLESYLGSKDYYGKYKIDLKTGDAIIPLQKAYKNDILDVFRNSHINLSDPSGLQESYEDGRKILRGLGLKMSDNVESIPTIINFGLVFLLLRKLYLNNILSIQNKHYKKVNGFNNVKVSDTFVEIIQDILNDKNYINKLSQLSNNEREIFDHLLYVAGLHKKLTGGSVADTEKLKKQLEILEGEIAAGNNNILLKKKLFNLLQKMAHYKMISAHGAQKHFKQFEQYFK
jgi:hypothetical protein